MKPQGHPLSSSVLSALLFALLCSSPAQLWAAPAGGGAARGQVDRSAAAQSRRDALEQRKSEQRQRQIQAMRQILRDNPQYNRKASLLFRIAEREWDEAQYRYSLERRGYDAQYEEYLAGRLSAAPEEPVPDLSLIHI